MINICKIFILNLMLILLLISCATNAKVYTEMDILVHNTEFTQARDTLTENQQKRRPLYNEKNAVSLFLDKGLLEHYAGNYAASSNDLENAERLIEEAYTKSITQRFFSYILNDNTKEYPGEDFEDIYINVFNSLNYYNRGNIEGALVEIRKLSAANGKLDMLSGKYDYVDPDSGEKIGNIVEKETGITELPAAVSVNFSNSALARYLGALFYQGDGNADAARIEFNEVYRAFQTNPNIYPYPVPDAVKEAENVPADKSRLNIITFTGLSPVKEEMEVIHFMPFTHPMLMFAKFKMPVMVRRPSTITRIEVIANGDIINLELLEDINAVVEETFKARYSNILLKTYIRTILKYTSANIASFITAYSQDEALGWLVALSARIVINSSERADIRMSRYLPAKAYIGGIDLDPGEYSVIINYYSGTSIISTDEYDNVIVRPNGLNLLQSVNLR